MAKKSSAKKGMRTADVCKELDIQPYVLRYWEGEFQALESDGKGGAQRVYSLEEMLVLRRIRELLYDEGYNHRRRQEEARRRDRVGADSRRTTRQRSPIRSPPPHLLRTRKQKSPLRSRLSSTTLKQTSPRARTPSLTAPRASG